MDKFREFFNFKNTVILFLSIGLFISPFITDQNNLPKGWELPKVWFWQLFSIFIFLNELISVFRRQDKFNLASVELRHGLSTGKVGVVLLILLLVSITISTFFTEDFTVIFYTTYNSPLYEFFGSTLNIARDATYKMSFLGNEFRQTGLITIGLLITLFWFIRRYIDRDNLRFIISALVLSSIIQSFIAITQFIDIIDSPKLIESGRFVYGSFGQSNFLVGLVVIGIILSFYLLKNADRRLRIALILAICIQVAAVVMTVSLWGIGVMVTGIFATILYENRERIKEFDKVFKFLVIASVIAVIPGLIIFASFFSEYKFRIFIWQDMYEYYIKAFLSELSNGNFDIDLFTRFVFGSGADTLGEVLSDSQRLTGIYVDRAHNIFFGVLGAFGAIGLVVFTFLLVKPIKSIKKNIDSREFIYPLIILWVLILRSMIHTNSIVNLVHIFVFMAVVYSICRNVTLPTGRQVNHVPTPTKS